eukprot:scaffold233605_cov23-Tisochrysis_lutea.AAC.4
MATKSRALSRSSSSRNILERSDASWREYFCAACAACSALASAADTRSMSNWSAVSRAAISFSFELDLRVAAERCERRGSRRVGCADRGCSLDGRGGDCYAVERAEEVHGRRFCRGHSRHAGCRGGGRTAGLEEVGYGGPPRQVSLLQCTHLARSHERRLGALYEWPSSARRPWLERHTRRLGA